MPLSQLYIYETAHGADSVDTHLEELREWNISPDFVGLELPVDGSPSELRDLLKQSPATAVALYVATKLQRWLMSRGSSNASRGDAEYEAGRQFANELGCTVQNVDRTRDDILTDHLTWPRRIWDTVLLAAAILGGISALLVLGIVLIGLPQAGISVGTLGTALVFLIIAFVLVFFALSFFSGIVSGFRNGIREARDEMMYMSTAEWCADHNSETALLIAGKAHSKGLSDLADQKGLDVRTRSAPSVKSVEGTSFGLKDVKQVYLDD